MCIVDVRSVIADTGWLTQGAMNVYAKYFMNTVTPQKIGTSLSLNMSTWILDPHPSVNAIVNLFICHYPDHWSLAVMLNTVSAYADNLLTY